MSDEVITRAEILSLVVRVAALSAISYYTVKWLMDAMDPTRKQKLRAQEKAKELMTEIGITGNLKLGGISICGFLKSSKNRTKTAPKKNSS